MKKINLSIPKPCHENWDAMTKADKGRFCASCQKTVIDFTSMSDRQIAEFFKKPPSSVCGRIYNDQLNSDIVIPKKRIPWIKYFFQFTWPAFMLLLKSCGTKENSKGLAKVEKVSHTEHEVSMTSIGYIMPGQELMISEITPVDTTVNLAEEKLITQGLIIEDATKKDTVINREADSVAMPIDTLDEAEVEYKQMDTVVVTAYSHTTTGKIIMGGISSVCTVKNFEAKQDTVREEIHSSETVTFKVYPNPVKTGSVLTISLEGSDDFPQQIQILSASGQLISQIKQNEKEYAAVTNIQIPSNITAGIYFLQMITKSKQVKTTKIIVTK